MRTDEEPHEDLLRPHPLPPTATSTWKNYAEKEGQKEVRLMFSDSELRIINAVIERLGDEAYKWHSLGTEYHRMFVRGYSERKTPVEDIAASAIETFQYRDEFKISAIFKERLSNHDIYHSSWPSYLAGEDVYGHFVCMERISELNIGNLEKFEKMELLKYRAQHIEALMRVKESISNTVKRRVCRYIFILDLKGFSINKHFTTKVKNILQPLFALSGDRYPDCLWSMYLINAPSLFRMAWTIIKGMVDPVVTAKIKILGNTFIPTMVSQGIPLESIPKEIGGEGELMLMSDVIEKLIEHPDDSLPAERFTTFSYFPTPTEPVKLNESILRLLKNDVPPTPDEKKEIEHVEDEIWHDNDNEELQEEEILFRGYLEKKGWYNRAWRKRFFILRRSGLYYYNEEPQTDSSSVSAVKEEPPRGMIDLLLMSKAEPVFVGEKELRFSRSRHVSEKKKAARSPLKRIKRIIARKKHDHAVLGSYQSFALNEIEDPTDPETGSAFSETDDFLIGFDLVTPYRTYNLRVCSDESEIEKESLVECWVQAIEKANKERMLEMQAIIKNEIPLHKSFLDRRIRTKAFFGSKYRRRYFVLTSQRLYWYTDINDTVGAVLKGKTEIKKIIKCNLKSVKEGEIADEFEIHFPRLSLMTLKAADAEEASQWVDLISKAVVDLKTRRHQMSQLSSKALHIVNNTSSPEPQINGRKQLDNLILDDDDGADARSAVLSVNTIDSTASQYSITAISENLRGLVNEAIRIGTEMKVISAESANKIPSMDDIYNGAKSTLASMYGRTTRRTKPPKHADSLQEVDITANKSI